MRLVAIMTISLFIFLGAAVYSETLIAKAATDLSKEIVQLEESIKRDDWQKASTMALDIEKRWKGIETKWDLVVDHREIDEVDLAIVRSIKYLEAEEPGSSLAEISALKHLLLHISQKESFGLKSIF